jgi:hypothetical protein
VNKLLFYFQREFFMATALFKASKLKASVATLSSIIVVCVLAACGGGGGDIAPVPANAATGPATLAVVLSPSTGEVVPGTTSVVVSAQALAPYQGTWFGVCEKKVNRLAVVVGSSREVLLFGQPGVDGSTLVTATPNYYTTGDCTGALFASVTASATTLSPAGTKTIAGVTALKLNVSAPAGDVTFTGAATLESCSSGGPLSVKVTLGTGVNAFDICETQRTVARVGKGLVSTISSANTFDVGNESDVDADGYPNSFEPVALGRFTN